MQIGLETAHGLLIHTDGYSIDTETYHTIDEAKHAMQTQYNGYMPSDGLEDEYASMSECNSDTAILHCNGEDVHVWRVISV